MKKKAANVESKLFDEDGDFWAHDARSSFFNERLPLADVLFHGVRAFSPWLSEDGPLRLVYLATSGEEEIELLSYGWAADEVAVLGRFRGKAATFTFDVDGVCVVTTEEEELPAGMLELLPTRKEAFRIAEELRESGGFEIDMGNARRRARTWFVLRMEDGPQEGAEADFRTLWEATVEKRNLLKKGIHASIKQVARERPVEDGEIVIDCDWFCADEDEDADDN